MDLSLIAISDFKEQFKRDFAYLPSGTVSDPDNYVQDEDIAKAFVEARMVFNQTLFSGDEFIKVAFLYVAAHYLVIDLKNALQGVNSVGKHIVTSRSVGSVSESYGIPEAYLKNPVLNSYAQTGYGLKYLSLVVAKIVGNVSAIQGGIIP